MTITSIVVVFSTSWFLALLVALPIGLRTQSEVGDVVPGTPGSAPSDPMIRKKVIWATIAALVISVPICLLIAFGGLTVADLDIWGVM
ncbi:DUF1467 family protein [Amaricoccus sp.]|uniref:DUF1467 family protein n=1 Tax=Amaricoccus sp. TaxID=1872485 RepID=UPI0026387621|nr:DUF1467 family protein [uncultured Amaricoccus sp.]